ncbi:hypothetical protein D3C71_1437640 [compost metagenome]
MLQTVDVQAAGLTSNTDGGARVVQYIGAKRHRATIGQTRLDDQRTAAAGVVAQGHHGTGARCDPSRGFCDLHADIGALGVKRDRVQLVGHQVRHHSVAATIHLRALTILHVCTRCIGCVDQADGLAQRRCQSDATTVYHHAARDAGTELLVARAAAVTGGKLRQAAVVLRGQVVGAIAVALAQRGTISQALLSASGTS